MTAHIPTKPCTSELLMMTSNLPNATRGISVWQRGGGISGPNT